MAAETIGKLKNLRLETDLSQGLKIVVPGDGDWGPHAERLRDLIGASGGGSPVVVTDEGPSLAGLKDGHWVLLGSAMNNPAIMALYRRNYAFVDDFYPGADGYALRTIHNPENQGHNVLMVGASRPEGAVAGLDQLERVLGQSGPALGRINIARAPAAETKQQTHMTVSVKPVDPQVRIPEMDLEAYREEIGARFERNEGRRVVSGGIEHGLTHHLTNDKKCARMFLEALFTYEDLVRNVHDGVWPFDHMIFVYAWVWRLAFTWDLIEESEAFTDAERLRMTNILLDLARYVQGLNYFKGDGARKMEIRQNHWTYAALSMRDIGEYFRSYIQ